MFVKFSFGIKFVITLSTFKFCIIENFCILRFQQILIYFIMISKYLICWLAMVSLRFELVSVKLWISLFNRSFCFLIPWTVFYFSASFCARAFNWSSLNFVSLFSFMISAFNLSPSFESLFIFSVSLTTLECLWL